MIAESTIEEQAIQAAPIEAPASIVENPSEAGIEIMESVSMPDSSTLSNASTEPAAPTELSKDRQRRERPHDQWEPLRAKARSKETVQARVIKWQR
ncbi:MAG TPA: hypothetical protein VFD13_06115, partial [Candidatus Kapabacteria bacterium]|nr:hypothetical protein [Candidatus Kapabacteria bacterium]